MNKSSASAFFVAAIAAAAPTFVGCSRPPEPTAAPSSVDELRNREVGERLFQSAVDMLNRLGEYDESHAEAAIAQMVRRLNESLASGVFDDDATEPFTEADGRVLCEIVWLRDAARYAVGRETDPVQRGKRLFDWTVRNIQLTDEGPNDERTPLLPWHAMLFGRGTALDRAWLFQLLARQQGLDVVLTTEPGAKLEDLATAVRPALIIGDHPYYFDPRRGLPLPEAPASGIAYLETSSPYVTPRFGRLERLLVGDDALVLSVDVDGVTQRARRCGLGEVRPLPLRDERYTATRDEAVQVKLKSALQPFLFGRTVRTPPLWQARVRQITGHYDYGSTTGRPTIVAAYQEARPAEEELRSLRRDSQLWLEAHRMKQHATYWLGLVSYDLGNFDTAVRYFELVLADAANGGWTAGARYNLGRTFEAMQQPEKATAVYRTTYLGVAPDASCLARAERLAGAADAAETQRRGTEK